MKILFFSLFCILALLTSAHAIFSQFVILNSESYQGHHEKYRPSLKVNLKNPDFIDVRIPFRNDGLGYWLIVASRKLPNSELDFRLIAWDGEIYEEIESFVRLEESHKLGGSDFKDKGYLEFTLHKDILKRCYVYHDYDSPVDDGGFYYTYDLSKHKIEQSAAHKSDPRGD